MPSPFAGMDPFIETQKWGGFHHNFITELGHRFVALLRPRYEVDPEERIYVENAASDPPTYQADVAISQPRQVALPVHTTGAVAELEPRVYAVPVPMEMREPYLVLKKTGEQKVVTVIELLSPMNKRAGSDGRREYLSKRRELLSSSAHLIEMDLLLRGQRAPTFPDLLPTTAYCCIVCRARRRPRAEVYEWTLRDRLPRIPIPLSEGDPDVIVDLQEAFNAVYDRSGYDYTLNYQAANSLTLGPDDESWLNQVVAARSAGAG